MADIISLALADCCLVQPVFQSNTNYMSVNYDLRISIRKNEIMNQDCDNAFMLDQDVEPMCKQVRDDIQQLSLL
jgi:hypothetical protein